MKYKERDELVSSLRELADFIEDDGIVLPTLNVYVSGYGSVYDRRPPWNLRADKTKALMRRIAIAMSPCEKDYSGGSFELKRRFGEKVRVAITAPRDTVCVKKVVGKKVVPKFRKYGTEEVDDVEWICGDPLLAS